MRHLATAVIVLTFFTLASCGVGSDRGTRQLNGDPESPAIDAIADTYAADRVQLDEMERDESGRMLVRTKIEVRFQEGATIFQVNRLLDDFAMEITSSIAGYPALVVRIPDPGTLELYNDIVERIAGRGRVVAEVYPSYRAITELLPPNVDDEINASPLNPAWSYVGQHLPVRGPAAWNLQGALQTQPALLVRDYFGLGQPSSPRIFNVSDALGDDVLRIRERNLNDAQRETAKHGYLVLSLITGTHSRSGRTEPADYVTGMMPQSVRLAAIDQFEGDDNDLENLTIRTLRRIAADNEGYITVTLGLGNECERDTTGADNCNAADGQIARLARKWAGKIRATGLENDVLIVSAAGNRDAAGNGPNDAQSRSIWNFAAGDTPLPAVLPDETELTPLSNALIVESVRRDNGVLPINDRCTADSSFTGGDIAAIGAGGVYGMADARSQIFRDPVTDEAELKDGGTSSATAQVAGLAAYLSALAPGLEPARAIRLIEATAVPVPVGGGNGCSELGNRAPLLDAYAAALAVDQPGSLDPRISNVRVALLDVVNGSGDFNPDGAFDEADVAVWRRQLGVNNPRFGGLFYDRWDLNGDGYHSGARRSRFDLDASGVSGNAPIYTINARGFDETAVTDTDVLCYYAFSPLYTGDINERNVELAGVCDEAPPLPDTEPPTVPQNLVTEVISTSRIELSWTASTDNEGVVGYNVFRDGQLLRTVSGTGIADNGLEANTQYCYRVSALDAAGNESERSALSCATTLSDVDTTPPSVPTNVQVADVTDSEITLTWDEALDDVGVTGYFIFRDGGRRPVAAVGVTTYTDTGLDPGRQYCYTVSAVDAAGNESEESAEVCATTDTLPTPVRFTLIADTDTPEPGGTGNFTRFREVAYNNGIVAFTAGDGAPSLFAAAGGDIDRIADPDDDVPGRVLQTFGPITAPAIDGGRIAFRGSQGIYLEDGGDISVVADALTVTPGGGTFFASFFGAPGFDNDEIVFGATDLLGERGLFLFDTGNGDIDTLIDSSTPIPGGGTFENDLFDLTADSIAIDSGRIAFTYGNGQGGGELPAVYTLENNNLDAVFDADTVLPGGAAAFTRTREVQVLNNTVLYTGTNADFTSIVAWRAGNYLNFDDSNLEGVNGASPYLGGEAPDVDSGNVLFIGNRGGVAAGDEGYLLYDGNNINWLVGVNDEVDGKLVTAVGDAALDGDVAAISLQFFDGSRGLYFVEIVP